MPDEFSLDDELDSAASAAAETIMSEAPPVSEHAVDAMADELEQTNKTDAEVKRDKSGTAFDPKIHTGSLLKSGNWRLKRTRGAPVVDPRAKSATEVATVNNVEQARAAAKAAASSLFMAGLVFGGSEWQPLGDDEKVEPINERKMMEDAFTDYFLAKGVTSFPPGAALALAIAAYSLPRFFAPGTKERAGKAKTWIALRVAKWQLNKQLKKRDIKAKVTIKDGELFIDGTRADRWNVGERKDNPSKETGGDVQEERVRNPRA